MACLLRYVARLSGRLHFGGYTAAGFGQVFGCRLTISAENQSVGINLVTRHVRFGPLSVKPCIAISSQGTSLSKLVFLSILEIQNKSLETTIQQGKNRTRINMLCVASTLCQYYVYLVQLACKNKCGILSGVFIGVEDGTQ